MNINKIIYRIATGLLSAFMLVAAGMYIFNYPEVVKIFGTLGFPAYIVYPLAAAKILGVAAILTGFSKTLKEWAYAGFFFDFLLALSAHLNAADGEFAPALVALVLLIVSYTFWKRLES